MKARMVPRISGHNGVLAGLALLVVLVVHATTAAQEVTAFLEDEGIYEGDRAILWVQISGRASGLRQPALPPVSGLEIRGPLQPQQRTQIVNGRTSQTLSYPFLLQPKRSGRQTFVVGPATIQRHGQQPLTTDTLTLDVYKQPTPGIHEFRADLKQKTGMVQAPFVARYTLVYGGQRADETDENRDTFFDFGGSRNPFGLSAFDLPLLEQKTILADPVVGHSRQAQRLRIGQRELVMEEGFEAREDGTGFRTLTFAFEILPVKTGPLELGTAAVGLKLVTDIQERRVRDVFGRTVKRTTPVLKEFRSQLQSITYTVQNPPAQGRPPSYNGAVGNYTISVEASATEVDAFAPITLSVLVKSRSRLSPAVQSAILENLAQPKWSKEEKLTREFDIAADVDPGVVEGTTKRFTQRIVPLSANVTEIPPIPFPFYNARRGRYSIAYSEAIPVTVRAVETVNSSDAISSSTSQAHRPSMTQTVSTIVEQLGIGANFTDMGTPQASINPAAALFNRNFLLTTLAGPVLFGIALLVRSRGQRDPTQIQRDQALQRAQSRLRAADLKYEAAATAFQDYFRDRLGVSDGELTPRDLTAALSRESLPESLQSQATTLLERFLSARFGGGGDSVEELSKQATDLLSEVNQCLR